jgi:hypothetical protein
MTITYKKEERKMTKKQKILKGIFLIFMCVLSLAMALHNYICLDEKYIYRYSTSHIDHKYYGGDAYTGIQQAVADTGNNVSALNSTVAEAGNEIMSVILLACAFIFTLIFFVCLYLTIKTFAENTIAQAKATTVEEPELPKIETEHKNDEISEIEKFNELKERGLLSAEEFELKKKQLLGI